MKALTLGDIPPAVAAAIEERARARKTSLGRAALSFIAEAAGLEVGPWIAASALELGLEVWTCDSDFERVPGLLVRRFGPA